MKIPEGFVRTPGTEIITAEGSAKVHRLIKEWRADADSWETNFLQPEMQVRGQQRRADADALERAVERVDTPAYMPAPLERKK